MASTLGAQRFCAAPLSLLRSQRFHTGSTRLYDLKILERHRAFVRFNRCPQGSWIVVNLSICRYEGFCERHRLNMDFDQRYSELMNRSAGYVMNTIGDICVASGASGEYSFVFRKDADKVSRIQSKLNSMVSSKFASAFVFNWAKTVPKTRLQYPPFFSSMLSIYPNTEDVKDYLRVLQSNWHTRNLNNTLASAIAKKEGLSKEEAELKALQTTGEKEKVLFDQFGTDYKTLPPMYKYGTLLFREKKVTSAEKTGEPPGNGTKKRPELPSIQRLHEDLGNDAFWEKYPKILE